MSVYDGIDATVDHLHHSCDHPYGVHEVTWYALSVEMVEEVVDVGGCHAYEKCYDKNNEKLGCFLVVQLSLVDFRLCHVDAVSSVALLQFLNDEIIQDAHDDDRK